MQRYNDMYYDTRVKLSYSQQVFFDAYRYSIAAKYTIMFALNHN